jgi:predicted ester cyclase
MASGNADVKALTRRWFEEVWNQGRQDTIDALLSPACVANGLTDENGRPARGPAGFRTFYERFRSAFSDIRIELHEVIAEGDSACARFTFNANHTGASLGPAATNRRVSFTGLTLCRWHEGQIVEAWNEFDAAGMNAQIS